MKYLVMLFAICMVCGCSTFTAGVRSIGAYEYSAIVDKDIAVGGNLEVFVKEGKSKRMGYDVLLRHVEYDEVMRTIQGSAMTVRLTNDNRYNDRGEPINGELDVLVETEEGVLKMLGHINNNPKVEIRDRRRTLIGYSMQPLVLVSFPLDVASSVLLVIGGLIIAPICND